MTKLAVPTSGWYAQLGSLSDWTTFTPASRFNHDGSIGWSVAFPGDDVVDHASGFDASINLVLDSTSGIPVAGLAFGSGSDVFFTLLVDARNGSGSTSSVQWRYNNTTSAYDAVATGLGVRTDLTYTLTAQVRGTSMRVLLVATTAGTVLLDTTFTPTVAPLQGITRVGVASNNGTRMVNLALEGPTPRASDRVTLAVLPAVSYVRTYYRLASPKSVPAVPTTNPPASPWTTVEPTYVIDSTDALYTTQLIAYGTAGFEYGPVQRSSSYDAARAAYEQSAKAVTQATIADGRLTVSGNAPKLADAAGKPDGAVWFRKNTAGLYIGAWELENGAWVVRTLADSVIGNLSAGKINAGELDADRIGANTITLRKMLIGTFNNFIEDPGFESNSTVAWSIGSGGGEISTENPRTGSRAFKVAAITNQRVIAIQQGFPVEPGEEYLFSAYVRATTASVEGAIELSVAYGATSATATSIRAVAASPKGMGTEYVQVKGVWKVPASARWARPRLVGRATHDTYTYHIDDVEFRQRNGGELIIDGSVQAKHIDAKEVWSDKVFFEEAHGTILTVGAIEVDMLSPSVGENLNLSANGSVMILTGQQSKQAGQIAEANKTLTDLRNANRTAASDAASALEDAASAMAKAREARAAADAVAGDVEAMGMFYRFAADGAVIGREDSPYQLGLRNDRAEFLENGVATTWWDGGQMVVPSLVTDEIALANHKVERYGTRTVVRSIG